MARVLVIDASSTTRKLVELAARRAQLSVEFSASGTDGLAQARARPPDAILLDFVLPGLTGPEVCRELARDPATAAVPVVMMTAKDAEARDALRELRSVVEVLCKPFTEEVLIAAVRAAISGKRAPNPAAVQGAKEALARALFEKLRGELANIPAWEAARGTEPAGPYYARRILTPELMGRLLQRLPSSTPPRAAEPDKAPPSALQPLLEQLRAERPVGTELPAPSTVFARSRGFSERLAGLQLLAGERRVLALIDGSSSISQLAARARIERSMVQEAIFRLAAIDLLRPAGAPAQGPVLILEPDAEGFTQPLQALLSRRPRALPLHSLEAGEDLPEAFRRTRPSLVILNEVAAGPRMERAAQAARELGVPIAAVLEGPDGARAAALVAAGFDAVLVKPIAYADLESLLESKGVTSGATNQL